MATQAVAPRALRARKGVVPRASRLVLGALVLIALLLMGRIIFPLASALLFAAVLAGALHPWLVWLAGRLGGRRQAAAIVLTVGVVVLLVVPVTLLAVSMGAQVVEGVAYVRDTLRDHGLPGLIANIPPSLRPMADWVIARLPGQGQEIDALAQNHTGQAAAAVGGVVMATTGIVLQVGMMVVALFFLLLDGPALVRWLAETTPLPDGQVIEVLTDFRNVSVAVLVSSVATAGAQTVAALAGYLVAGVPQVLFFTAVTFVVAFIPAIGAATVVVALAGLLYLTGHPTPAALLALWGVLGVGFIDNLVKPLLMKGRMEVHGALIFFALVGGLAAFGPVGLVAGPLVLSFFLAVVRLSRHPSHLHENPA
jgi:predicted PurR-regulated permease PerM